MIPCCIGFWTRTGGYRLHRILNLEPCLTGAERRRRHLYPARVKSLSQTHRLWSLVLRLQRRNCMLRFLTLLSEDQGYRGSAS